jgi:predicted nuclease of predicted toxin-antitoxin system
MKLLFDQNLSFKLCLSIADMFPESSHVSHSGLSEAYDRDVWDYAKANGFAIVSQDADFAEMATLLGSPPKVIWLRVGNQSTEVISTLLRHHAELILALADDRDAACLEIY